MKNTKHQPFYTLLLVIALITMAHAYKAVHPSNRNSENQRLLGSVSAGHNGDHDVIQVNGIHDYYRWLKIKVSNSPLNITRMVVTYDDEAVPENIEVRNEISKGGESRLIDLQGGMRKIRTVEFWFEKKGILNENPEVTFFRNEVVDQFLR